MHAYLSVKALGSICKTARYMYGWCSNRLDLMLVIPYITTTWKGLERQKSSTFKAREGHSELMIQPLRLVLSMVSDTIEDGRIQSVIFLIACWHRFASLPALQLDKIG